MNDERMHPAPQARASTPRGTLDPAFIVPTVGGEVVLNGEVFRVDHIHLSNERVDDGTGKGRHFLKLQVSGYWDEVGYQAPREGDS